MDVKHVFADWYEVDAAYGVDLEGYKPHHGSPKGIKLVPHKPIKIETEEVFSPDQPWDAERAGHPIVIKIGNKYHAWYEGLNKTPEWICLCYAYSEDGIHWIKPDLGIIEFGGNKHNNIVKMNGKPGMPWVDEGEAVYYDEYTSNEDERYKMLSTRVYYEGTKQVDIAIVSLVSKDGLHWNEIGKAFLGGDSYSALFYDPDLRKYIATAKSQYSNRLIRRDIVFSESEDFRTWSKPRIVVGSNVNDDPDTDYYNSALVKWPGVSDAYVMMPSLFHRTDDTVDTVFFFSRDLYNFSSPRDFYPIAANDVENGMQIYTSACVVAENNTFIHYFSSQNEGHNGGGFGHYGTKRAIWREDGYISLTAENEGAFTSIPYNIGKGGVILNADIAKDGYIQIAVTEECSNDPYPGFSHEDMIMEKIDEIHYLIKWKADFSSLPEKTKVRLNFKLKKCDIYSYTFKDVEHYEGEDGACPYIVVGAPEMF